MLQQSPPGKSSCFVDYCAPVLMVRPTERCGGGGPGEHIAAGPLKPPFLWGARTRIEMPAMAVRACVSVVGATGESVVAGNGRIPFPAKPLIFLIFLFFRKGRKG